MGVLRYPFPRTDLAALPADLVRLMQTTPVCEVELWDGGRAWLITRFEDVRFVLGDSRFSSDPRRPGFPRTARNYAALVHDRTPAFTQLDDPEHARMRRTVAPEFTARQVSGLRPWIREIAEQRLADLLDLDNPADLVAGFATPIPTMTLARILGVPYADHEFFRSRALVRFDRGATAEDLATADGELRDYLTDLAAQRLRHPGEDLLSRLAGSVHTGLISQDEFTSTGALLLFNGYLTTANLIALAALCVLADDGLRATLSADRTLIPQAVEEIARLHTIGESGLPRLAMADVVVGGVTIRAGDAVIVSVPAANRDPAVFTEPDALDIHRPNRRHLAFGHGSHACLGVGLARTEVEIALDVLFDGPSTLSLAVGLEELELLPGSSLLGVRELPVRW